MPPPLSTDPASVVLTFLESIGRRADAEFYLRLFRRLPKESFAVIAAEASVIEHAAGSVAVQTRFLSALGLFAPIVVGLFAPRDSRRAGDQLADVLADEGAEIYSAAQADLVGSLRSTLRSERLPVVTLETFPGNSKARFTWLGDLMAGLGTRKLVVLTTRGGLGPSDGLPLELGDGHFLATHHAGISVINLTTDYARLRAFGRLDSEEQLLLDELRDLLLREDCAGAVASVTSPLSLLRELFTVKGAGTLLKKGTRIARHTSYDRVDTRRLRELFESSFGRKLDDEFFNRPPLTLYIEENYRGAAVLVDSSIAPFLTKFAVGRLAQGEGIGRDLWQAMTHDHPSLFWRARAANPIATWYDKVCDGLVRTEQYNVYWRGIPPDQVPSVVREATRRPDDFDSGPQLPSSK